MPNPPSKVAAMASIFQQQAGEEKDEDTMAGTVKKGRQSLPVFGEAGFVKHKKAALKRTNSQKDRFSNARMMFEKKGSGDNLLDASRSSITTAISNTSSIIYSANKTSTRQFISVSSVEEDENTNLADMKNYPIEMVDKQDEVRFPVVEDSTMSDKENIPHSESAPTPTASLTTQSQVLSPNRQSTSAVHSKSDISHFLELESKSPLENSSPSPPPLPSLPPPPLMSEDKPSLLGEEEIVLNSLQQQSSSSCDPDLLEIVRKLSFSHNTDLVTDNEADIPRSDSQSTLLEYAELCDSLPSVEYVKMEEEFDRLADMTDLGQLGDQADDEHNNQDESKTVFQESEESEKPPDQVLESIQMSKSQDSIESSKKSNITDAESPNLMKYSSSTKSSDIEVLKRDDDPTTFLTDTPTESDTGSPSTDTLEHDLLVGKETQVGPTISTNGTYLNNDIKLVTHIAAEAVIDVLETMSKSVTPIQDKSMNKSQTVSEDGNTSSLGSSLVGQSVSSWLGTPGSVSAQSINTNPSPKTGADQDSSKYIPSTEESSDYVSGDSCELGSSSLEKVDSKHFPLPHNGVEGKIHYLSDGNFWIEGPPMVPTSLLEESPNASKLYHPPTMVKFSTSPIKIFSTYTDEEYDRSNEDIDPAAASAEYELEKRVEKMETFEVNLTKGEEGLGLSILGMGVGVDTGVEKLGIFIKTITAGGAAAKDGRIQVNDQIISVDGSSLVGVTQAFAASVLRNTAGLVQFVVGRDEEPGESEVAQLIRQSVQADMEEQSGVADEEENNSTAGVSLSSSSSVEGDLSFSCEMGEKQDSIYMEEVFSKPPFPEDDLSESAGAEGEQVHNYESTDNVDHHGVNISQENIGKEISVEQENLDCTTAPEEDIPNTSTAKILGDKDVPVACCSYEDKYKTLLAKYEQAQEVMGQMKKNMNIVTEQLVCRDQLFSSHMDRLREVFSQLEEKLNDTDKVVACQQTLLSALEPRGVLRRKPFIPTTTLPEDTDLPASSLDLIIPPTPLLNTTLARDRMSLVHRGTLTRRRQSTKSYGAGSATTIVSASGLGQRTEEEGKVAGGSGFKDELRKTLMMNSRRNAIPGSEGATVSSTPPLSPTRASSLPCSPTRSLYSSTSSLQSVPDNLEGPTEFRREKKRLSGKSLWQKARRRLSSR